MIVLDHQHWNSFNLLMKQQVAKTLLDNVIYQLS